MTGSIITRTRQQLIFKNNSNEFELIRITKPSNIQIFSLAVEYQYVTAELCLKILWFDRDMRNQMLL